MQQDPKQEPMQNPEMDSDMESDSAPDSEARPPSPIITFTSGKGGCGKTTLAANFANIIAQSQNKVLFIDLDLRNLGTTGPFAYWSREPHRNFTLTRLLRDEVMIGNKPRMLIEVKPGFYLMPASSLNEPEWEPPRRMTFADFVEDFRSKILDLAERFDISCVVLDCYCGFDLLTTAGAGVADHTIIVNEPDTITFSESMNLLNHLQLEFADLEEKPKLHFVINRMKGSDSVTQLESVYKENLEKEADEEILCHFPYHDRIAETFGKHPFISDLIPRSLFVRKLELLSCSLFKGRMDHLIKRKVRKWSGRKIRSIYNRSIDRVVVDSRYLARKFANFSLLAGLWLIVSFILMRTFAVGPILTWIFLLLSVAAGSSIIFFSILHGFGLATLLCFSRVMFQFRFGRLQQAAWTKTRRFLSTLLPLLGGILMSITVLAVGVTTTILVGVFLDWTFNVGILTEPNHHFKNRLVEVAMEAPIRTLDLRGAKLKYTDLSKLGTKQGEFTAGDTTFQACQFGASALQTSWNDCTFIECSFVDPNYTQYKGIEVNHSTWRDVSFIRFVTPQLIIFENSDLRNVKIQVGAGAYIKFLDCKLDQTDLIPGDNCVVAFREKVELLRDGLEIKETVDRVAVLPDGLNIKGEVNIVTEEEFEALTSKLWPQLSLAERIRQKNTSLESAGAAGKKGSKSYRMDLAFLIEYLILSGGESLDEATELNDGLSVLATESKDVNSTGLSYMLSLLIATVRELPHETALAAWTDWLESNDGWRGNYQLTGGDEYDRQMEWFWYIWNEHLSLLSLSNEQRSLLNAIKASAQARITADDLRVIFKQITPPSETSEE